MKSIIILVIAFLSLFCSCHENDLQTDQRIPLTLFADTTLRALSRYGLPLPDVGIPPKIGLLVMEGETDKPYMGMTEYIGVKATLENGKWITDIPIYLGSESPTIYAYYPDTINITDLNAIPVNSRKIDLLLGKCLNMNNQAPVATLQLHHAFARLRIRIFYYGTNPNYAETDMVTIGNSKAVNFAMDGTLNIFSGELTPAVNASHVGGFMLPYEKYPVYDVSEDKAPLEMLVFPIREFANKELAFRVTYRLPIMRTFTCNLEAGVWLPGKIYDYNLVVNPMN